LSKRLSLLNLGKSFSSSTACCLFFITTAMLTSAQSKMAQSYMSLSRTLSERRHHPHPTPPRHAMYHIMRAPHRLLMS
jgi:hypothetical protein